MKALLLPLLLLGSAACDAQAPAGNAATQPRALAEAAPSPLPALPALTGRVVDQADILPGEAEAALTARLAALEAATADQLVVVTWPSLGGESIEKLGLRLGNGWGIGQKYLDNGVLLIVAPNDRRARIEVGTGLEGLLTDDIASRIIDRQMAPHFRQGSYPEGIRAGVLAIEGILQSDPKRPRPNRRAIG
ncbi:MAG TPA: TPM domain-containing protein [Allosphingosinicella sp.]|nr:TPM domain-containing protein [Allosphingosinicella sp.]